MQRATSTVFALSLATAAVGATACGGSDEACVPGEPGTICTIAGDGKQAVSDDGVPALASHLNVPQDMAVSPEGDLWILDFNNYFVKRLAPDGNLYTEIGNGLLGNAPNPGEDPVPSLDAPFNHTSDLFFHDGYLYLAAWHNSFVKRVNLTTMMQENYAGIGKRTRYMGEGGPALEAALDLPSSIALDPNGDVVIMDQANQVIRRVDQEGIIHRVAGQCIIDSPDACDEGEEPVLCPESQKLTCGDPATTCCTTPNPETGTCEGVLSNAPCTPRVGGDGGDALVARMAQPFGQAAVPAGRIAYAGADLIFADTDGHRIRKIGADGVISTIAGTGTPGFSGDGGPGTEAEIYGPVDVEATDDGTVYFADTQNSCIRKLVPSGDAYTISTVAGICDPDPRNRDFSGDGGPATEARLSWPAGIEVDGDTLYVADSYNMRVRLVSLASAE